MDDMTNTPNNPDALADWNKTLERWPGYNEQSWQQRFAELDLRYGDMQAAMGDRLTALEAPKPLADQTQEQVTQALEPCPFCGGGGLPHRVPTGWRVSCKNCDCQPRPGFPSDNEADAITAWNTRIASTPPSPDGLREALAWPGRLHDFVQGHPHLTALDGLADECERLAKATPKIGEPDPLWWERQASLREAGVNIRDFLQQIDTLNEGKRSAPDGVASGFDRHVSAIDFAAPLRSALEAVRRQVCNLLDTSDVSVSVVLREIDQGLEQVPPSRLTYDGGWRDAIKCARGTNADMATSAGSAYRIILEALGNGYECAALASTPQAADSLAGARVEELPDDYFNRSQHDDQPFIDAWTAMEHRGYQYSERNVEKVHLGWQLAHRLASLFRTDPRAQPDAGLREALEECRTALPVLSTMCQAANLSMGSRRAMELLVTVDAALAAQPQPQEPMQCPECGVGRPGHRGGCSRATVLTLGPREPQPQGGE